MKQSFENWLFDAWIYVKIKLGIPLPIKNHFYKGHRITLKRNWFCASCQVSFDLLPFKDHANKPLSDRHCPNCRSKSIHWSTGIFKSTIDKKPKEFLHLLSTKTYPYEF